MALDRGVSGARPLSSTSQHRARKSVPGGFTGSQYTGHTGHRRMQSALIVGTKINSIPCTEDDVRGKTAHSVTRKRARDYVLFKERNVPGPWAIGAYEAPVPHLATMGAETRVQHVPGHVNFSVGSAKVDYVTATALKKKGLPAPNEYVPELHWKPANNFQKQTKTKKVTMTAEIMQHKK